MVSNSGLRISTMSQNNPGCLRDPIWQFIGVLIAFVSLLFTIIWSLFVYLVPHSPTQTPTSVGRVTYSPTSTHTTPTPTSNKPNDSSTSTNSSDTTLPNLIFQAVLIGAVASTVSIFFIPESLNFGDTIAGIIGALLGGFLAILLGWSSGSNYLIGDFIGAGVSITLLTLFRFLNNRPVYEDG
jgi:uncharacterized membrane protein YeaQ/YmgE (transglycosylase-associated protein family)